jgi:hypothetical protein
MQNHQELPLCPVLIRPDIDKEPPRKRLKSDSGSHISLLHAARLTLSHTRPSPLRVDNECNKKSIDAWFQRGPKKRQTTLEQPPKQSSLSQTYRFGNARQKASQVSALRSERSDPKALPPGRPLRTPHRLEKYQEMHLI